MPILETGSLMPDFELIEPATGKTIASRSLQPYAPAVIVFTTNHCPHAQAWEGRLLQIARDYVGRVSMVMISANDPVVQSENTPENLAKRAKERDYPVPYLYDEDQSAALAYGARRTPHAFVFDANSRLAYQGTVDDNQEEPEAVKVPYLRDAIEAVLADRPAPIEQTAPEGCGIKWRPGNAPEQPAPGASARA
jgi:peroxiredoxin